MRFATFTLALFLLLGGCASVDHRAPSAVSDPPAMHGMLIFGEGRIFASHLPMFHRPHDYQGIFEIELTPQGRAAYEKSRHDYPRETIYTLVPTPFSLPQMARNPVPFTAQIYRGHFERGGTVIADDVPVRIRQVVYFEKFDPNASHPAATTYLLFGDETEQFAAHLISIAPDFDQISELEAPELGRALASQPLLVGTLPEARGPLDITPQDLHFILRPGDEGTRARVHRVLYLEYGDLAQ